MKPITQTKLAEQLKISQPYINQLVSTKKRPSWKMAKKLASATDTPPILWLEGTKEEIKAALKGSQS